jgi:hypothetical protein
MEAIETSNLEAARTQQGQWRAAPLQGRNFREIHRMTGKSRGLLEYQA